MGTHATSRRLRGFGFNALFEFWMAFGFWTDFGGFVVLVGARARPKS